MKKAFISIAVAMMSILFVGCEKENTQVEPDRDVANKIIGKWITAESDSKVLPTNEKIVYDFVSATEAYVSLSFTETTNGGTPWSVRDDVDVDIVGNDIILTHNPEPGTTVVVNIHVNAITGTTLIGKRNITVRKDGGLVRSEESMIRCEKLDVDYSTKILGLWEGKMTSDQSAFDDGQEHRWEFKEDGTFVFYLKDDKGIWVAKDDEYANYFVAGNLLCTRWKNAGVGTQELREWWEIATAGDKSMVWTALREKEDGSQYTAAFTMQKLSVPTQAEVEKAIVGKWITAQADGKALPTNEKIVFDIVSPTEAYVSLSIQDRTAEDTPWSDREEVDVEINGNDVILSHSPKPGMTVVVGLHIESITDATLTAKRTVTIRQDGGLVRSTENMVRYEKLNVDYRNAICGIWEGMSTGSEGSEFDDGEHHRWEYKADGTFVYYVKDGNNWVASANTLNEYFVAGNLLCTRWVDNGVENREWWEILNIGNGTMIWTALREDEQGNSYVASFAMNKVN